MTPDIEQIRSRLEALKTGWTSIAQWQQVSLDFRRHIIEDETALLATIDELTRDLNDAVDAHIKITAAMRCGGRTPEKALDTMLRIRRKLGRDE